MRFYEVFGVPFVTERRTYTLNYILNLAAEQKAASVFFVNAHVCVESQRHPEIKNYLKKSTLNIPDGAPVAWLLKKRGATEADRYPGPDLMLDVLTATPDKKHFFLGSTPKTLEQIKNRFPNLKAQYVSPPFGPQLFDPPEMKKQIKVIEEFGADFIWVGLGAPRQERYVIEAQALCKRGVWLAVGAAFDFIAGTKSRAPQWVRQWGLEWAYRMMTEPRRLGKRYLSTNPQFLVMAAQELAKAKTSLSQ